MIPLIMILITPTTATYLISSDIKASIHSHVTFCFGLYPPGDSISLSGQPGRPIQFTLGASVFGPAAKATFTAKKENPNRNRIEHTNNFFIILFITKLSSTIQNKTNKTYEIIRTQCYYQRSYSRYKDRFSFTQKFILPMSEYHVPSSDRHYDKS